MLVLDCLMGSLNEIPGTIPNNLVNDCFVLLSMPFHLLLSCNDE